MTTTLRDIFKDPVDRPIEGVIKADDEAALATELKEYVITKEIEKKLELFLNAYNDYQTANGVWVSGFFGSGKSHLLKMLALLLENRVVDGTRAFDFFIEKCGDNEILRADLKRAASIPSKSILFNIDQKADVITKTQFDALLSVFQKVFDEMCGYYGKQPHIAQFERELDSRDQYQKFKNSYQHIAGKPWERGREQYLLEGASIAKAYGEAAGVDAAEANNILNRYRNEYRQSIEDFAKQVKDYIDTQPPGFRLNFFVDEVGQYIADNVKLMTNLQTLAESLNTKCRGQSWILVTAQQDMNAVIGDMSQRQENDFSKIQARFANRLPLNSADVAEVIQKRLLKKTDRGIELLSGLHAREANNLKTLFDFSDGSTRLKNFADRDHFIHSYPFIPYQYTLFQMAIENLSQHNAFEGKHSSVGERSMLGVFQDVAVRLADLPVGDIATFDLMFEGIRSALKSNVQRSIQVAERNLGDEFAVKVLKALFLVKYVKPFKPTVRNISILLLERFDADQTKHRRRIEEALNLLEQNTYIQRSGDLFEFLTDEEKDVEQEIKATDVDSTEIAKELEELIFDTVIKLRKIHHDGAGYDYSFARRLDDRLVGRDHELSINVITPFGDSNTNPDAVRMKTVSSDELAVLLSPDPRFVADLMMYKRTEKYVRQARSNAQQPALERIIADKAAHNVARFRDLTARLRSLLSDARIFVRGDELDIRPEDPQQRIEHAFQTLVDKVYTNLRMLRGVTYSEADIGGFLKQGGDGILGSGAAPLTEAEQEILNVAQANARTGVRTTAKAVVERFEAKSYGWPYAAILCNLAGLLGRGKLEAKTDGTILEGGALEKTLKNSQALGNLVLDLQVDFTPAQIRALKDFFKDFFDRPAAGTDAKSLGTETAAALKEAASEVANLLARQDSYPFTTALDPVAASLRGFAGKAYGWYLTDLPKDADKLLDAKDQILDPMRRFFGGTQRNIYDEARAFLAEHQSNFSYVDEVAARAIRDALDDANCFKGNAIQQLKNLVEKAKVAVTAKISEEKHQAEVQFKDLRAKLEDLPDFARLEVTHRGDIERRLETVLLNIRDASLIAVIRERASNFRTITFPLLLEQVTEWAKQNQTTKIKDKGTGEENSGTAPPTPTPKTEFVAGSTLNVPFNKPYLSDPADVEAYLKAMREVLLSEINSGKRITI